MGVVIVKESWSDKEARKYWDSVDDKLKKARQFGKAPLVLTLPTDKMADVPPLDEKIVRSLARKHGFFVTKSFDCHGFFVKFYLEKRREGKRSWKERRAV